MSMIPEVIECPRCSARSCKQCLVSFTSSQNKNIPQNDLKNLNVPCTQCHEKVHMKEPNRIMTFLLKNVFRINCTECSRHWQYDEYLVHKQRGLCHKDPTAANTIANLQMAAIERRANIAAAANASGQAQAQQMVQAIQQASSINNAGAGQPFALSSIYVLERDSKYIYEYKIQTKQVFRRSVNIANSFQHNFAYIQTPSDKIFLIGGGDIQRKPDSLKQCHQIVNNNSNLFDCLAMDEMKYSRHGHSVCCLNDKFLIVTGSRCEDDESFKRCEQYNIDLDLWFEIPNLHIGRHYHSSCTYNERFVFVFCGIAQSGKKYCNSIERYDSSNRSDSWVVINIPSSQFAERQGAGVVQITKDEIVIFGGFSGRFLKDCSIFNATSNTMRKATVQPDIDLFAFQMPTVRVSDRTILTADWQSKKVIEYTCDTRFKPIKDLKST